MQCIHTTNATYCLIYMYLYKITFQIDDFNFKLRQTSGDRRVDYVAIILRYLRENFDGRI